VESHSVDAYSPKEIAARIEQAGTVKSQNDPLRVFALAVLAGAFIALGAMFYTIVTHDPGEIAAGIMRLLGGFVFCLGLILVIIAGAELFTGNNLIVMAYVDGKVTLKALLTNWWIVFTGNLVGAVSMMFLVYLSGHWQIGDGALATKVVAIANSKVNLPWIEAFTRGVLCNILVCLAVWLCFAGRTVVDKVVAIIFPITAFVALGFEHCVANMYFIPAGIMLKGNLAATSALSSFDLGQLTVSGFLLNNLLPVTLGNIIGGSVFVGLFYWFIYLRKK
jgi:formate/nitrite transporter